MKSLILSALLLKVSFSQPIPVASTTPFTPIRLPGDPTTTANVATAPATTAPPDTTAAATTVPPGHPVLPRPSTEPPVIPTTTTILAPVTTVRPAPPAGFVYGAFGQLCELTTRADRYRCQWPTATFTDTNGFAICERSHSCCQCAEITCGYNGVLCEEIAFGTASAKYVSNIKVNGNTDYGATVTCNGNEACMGATITGTSVGAIDCDGARSCQFAKFLITDPVDQFVVECGGASACEGLSIEINYSGPPPGYMCAWQANPVKYPKLTHTIAAIECAAGAACAMADITINNEVGCRSVTVAYVECLASDACTGATFDLIGDVTLAECACGTSCASAVGLDTCYTPASPLLV